MIENLSLMTGPIEAEDDFNLTVVRTNDSILVGRKTRGFGSGRLVLPGGKTRYYIGGSGMAIVSFIDEAAREAHEETGIPVTRAQMTQRGVLHITDEDDTKIVRLYQATVESAIPVSSTELSELGWYSTETIPYGEMPSDYRLWLPHVIAGYAVSAFFEVDLGDVVDAQIFRQKIEPLGRLEQVPVEL